MIAHLGASIMFGDTIVYDAKRQVALNLKQLLGINSKLKILCQLCLSASIQKIEIKIAAEIWWKYIFQILKGS